MRRAYLCTDDRYGLCKRLLRWEVFLYTHDMRVERIYRRKMREAHHLRYAVRSSSNDAAT